MNPAARAVRVSGPASAARMRGIKRMGLVNGMLDLPGIRHELSVAAALRANPAQSTVEDRCIIRSIDLSLGWETRSSKVRPRGSGGSDERSDPRNQGEWFS